MTISNKMIVAGALLIGLAGCGENQETSNNNDSNHKQQTLQKNENSLDKLTATLPRGINANDARKNSNEATNKLFQEYFVNGAGKAMLETSINIINERIKKMSSGGVFSGTNLNTFMLRMSLGSRAQNDMKPIDGYLKSMSDEQKNLFKNLIVNYYTQQGYEVVEGEYNYPDRFHYLINW